MHGLMREGRREPVLYSTFAFIKVRNALRVELNKEPAVGEDRERQDGRKLRKATLPI